MKLRSVCMGGSPKRGFGSDAGRACPRGHLFVAP
jgi:hypothetical protein